MAKEEGRRAKPSAERIAQKKIRRTHSARLAANSTIKHDRFAVPHHCSLTLRPHVSSTHCRCCGFCQCSDRPWSFGSRTGCGPRNYGGTHRPAERILLFRTHGHLAVPDDQRASWCHAGLILVALLGTIATGSHQWLPATGREPRHDHCSRRGDASRSAANRSGLLALALDLFVRLAQRRRRTPLRRRDPLPRGGQAALSE